MSSKLQYEGMIKDLYLDVDVKPKIGVYLKKYGIAEETVSSLDFECSPKQDQANPPRAPTRHVTRDSVQMNRMAKSA